MIWDTYEVVDYFPGQWSELSGREARIRFDALMTKRLDRIEKLSILSGLNLDDSDKAFLAIHDWIVGNIQAAADQPRVPNELWRSILRDIALYIGEALTRNATSLAWELRATGPTMLNYREPVIRGFTKVAVRNYEVGPMRVVFSHGCDALNKERRTVVDANGTLVEIGLKPIKRDQLLRFYRSALALA